MNRKIALSGLSIVAALTLMGVATFAAFTSTATATGTTFSTTTPVLQVSTDSGVTFGTSKAGPSVTGLVPGVAGSPVTIELRNTDTDPSSDLTASLQLTASNTNTLPGVDLTITVNCGGGDVTDTYAGWISTGHLLNVTVPHTGTPVSCVVTPTLNSGTGNSDMGKSAIFDAAFSGSVGT